MSKLRVLQEWDQAEKTWDEGVKTAEAKNPLKKLTKLPVMPGIVSEDARFLKLKSLSWMIRKDERFSILRYVMKSPFLHGYRYLKSVLTRSHKREGDFYFYGLDSFEAFEKEIKDSIFVVGFSYCHKPFECPSGRFTDQCIHDPENSVCRQCFIGKAINLMPDKAVPLLIPTIHYIGNKIFELINKHRPKKVLFLITACEMTLEMFGDYGNMAGVKGIGVRLDGRICNTMKAFQLSETGIKPGLTIVLEPAQKKILELIKSGFNDTL